MSIPATESRSTGRVLGSWQIAWLRVEGHWMWYRRYWRSNLYSSGLQPVLFLAAMGLGFGSQVRPEAVAGGWSYLHYVAPAMLLVGAVWTSVGEASFPVLSGFKWQRNYIALSATPVTAGQILHGQLLWVAIRLLLACGVYALVAVFFGAWLNAAALLVVLVGVFTGLACAAPVMAYSASITGEGTELVLMFRFVVMPMTLFAGTFFPIEQIPIGLRWLAWISPLWHGTELARGAALGGLPLLAAIGHLLYLGALLAVGSLVARRCFQRRLVV